MSLLDMSLVFFLFNITFILPFFWDFPSIVNCQLCQLCQLSIVTAGLSQFMSPTGDLLFTSILCWVQPHTYTAVNAVICNRCFLKLYMADATCFLTTLVGNPGALSSLRLPLGFKSVKSISKNSLHMYCKIHTVTTYFKLYYQ